MDRRVFPLVVVAVLGLVSLEAFGQDGSEKVFEHIFYPTAEFRFEGLAGSEVIITLAPTDPSLEATAWTVPKGADGSYSVTVTCSFIGPGVIEVRSTVDLALLDSMPIRCEPAEPEPLAALSAAVATTAAPTSLAAVFYRFEHRTASQFSSTSTFCSGETTSQSATTETINMLLFGEGSVCTIRQRFVNGSLDSSSEACASAPLTTTRIFQRAHGEFYGVTVDDGTGGTHLGPYECTIHSSPSDLMERTTTTNYQTGVQLDATLALPDDVPTGSAVEALRIVSESGRYFASKPFGFLVNGTPPTVETEVPTSIFTRCVDDVEGEGILWELQKPAANADGTINFTMVGIPMCAEAQATGTVSFLGLERIGLPYPRLASNMVFEADVSPQEFEIRLAAWVPGNYVNPPFPHGSCFEGPVPSQGIKKDVLDRGDDRLSVDADGSAPFRLRERVIVVPDASFDEDGLKDGAIPERVVGLTREYAEDALTHGLPQVDDGDDDAELNDCILLNRRGRATNTGMSVDVIRVSPTAVDVDLKASVGNPLYALSGVVGPIQWDLKVTIDVASGAPLVSVSGEHGSFPAFELFVDDTLVYSNFPDPVATFDPPPPHHEADDVLSGLWVFNTKPVSVSDFPL